MVIDLGWVKKYWPLLVSGALCVAVCCGAIISAGLRRAYEQGERVGREDASLAPPSGTQAGAHNRRLRKLADKLAVEGFVWDSPEGDQSPNQPGAWGEKCQILHRGQEGLIWQLRRENSTNPLDASRIELSVRMARADEWWMAAVEWKKWEDELPAGSPAVIARLGKFAYAMYEEDHEGRAQSPQLLQGTSRVIFRRRSGLQDYGVLVGEDCGEYTIRLVILEQSQPRGFTTSLYAVLNSPRGEG